jgi:hypothetical protein
MEKILQEKKKKKKKKKRNCTLVTYPILQRVWFFFKKFFLFIELKLCLFLGVAGGWGGGRAPGGGPGGEKKGGNEGGREGGKKGRGRGEKPRLGRFCGLPGLCVELWFFFPEALRSRDRRSQIVRVLASPSSFWRLLKPSLHSPDFVCSFEVWELMILVVQISSF